MERKQFGSRFSYDDHHAQSSMPGAAGNKFSKEQSNAKPDSSDKRAYFTVHVHEQEKDHSNS